MGWIRTKRAAGCMLALFALACQAVLTFGHVHLDSAGRDGWVVATNMAGARVVETPSAPSKQPNGLAGDICPLCANIGLAGTLLAPAAPTVHLPDTFVRQVLWSVAAIMPDRPGFLLFSARGPPNA